MRKFGFTALVSFLFFDGISHRPYVEKSHRMRYNKITDIILSKEVWL